MCDLSHKGTRSAGARPRFTAIVGHADDASLLRCCIQHHLAIGVEHVFVSLNGDDPESAAVVASFPDDKVKGEAVRDYTDDTLLFFTAAVRRATEWSSPDWVLFVDTDEFWVPARGRIDEVAGLDRLDVLSVGRYNSPPIRGRAGAITWADPVGLGTPIFGDPQVTVDGFAIEPRANPPWITTKVGPKVMVRPELVRQVARGGHAVVGNVPVLRERTPTDLVIVHLPFTTGERFRRKIRAVERRIAEHEHRNPGGATHWHRWVAVGGQDLIEAEYAHQIVDQADLDQLTRSGILTTPEKIFQQALVSQENG
jgi:hypothetical protein